MTCPACQGPLASGEARCPECGAMVSPPLEGALAPDPRQTQPPAAGKVEPLREIPALRRRDREPAWKDEVRERVRHRRHNRGGDGGELPLFRSEPGAAQPGPGTAPPPPARDAGGRPRRPPARSQGDRAKAEAGGFLSGAPKAAPPRTDQELEVDLGEAVVDLPLRGRGLEPSPDAAREGADGVPGELDPAPAPRYRDLEPEPEWRLDSEETEGAPLPDSGGQAPDAPVERPARLLERLQAGALDLTVLAALWAVVVFFAGRAAQVPVAGLLPAWPYLIAYLALLGLFYAGYFTGTTGQTLGKRFLGLRVVDGAGRPPGYIRALARTVLGVGGLLLAGAGQVPIAFDPARRAFHDRLLKMRVVKG